MVVFAGFINLSYHIKLSISKLSLFTPSSTIYIRLHRAKNEEIEDETRRKAGWMMQDASRRRYEISLL